MTNKELISIIGHAIDVEPEMHLQETTRLEEIVQWDSLAVISVIALFDLKFGVLTSAAQLGRCQTVGDLITLLENFNGTS